jgi:GntR family transcriptional regulator, N-acetylglucosamine utilization regulator
VAVVSATAPGLSRDSPVPLHYQLRHVLIEMIERGEIRSGEALPSERDLAARFDISIAPVRQAILDLVKEGVLFRVRGKGTFLHEPALVEHVSILSSFTASMRERGLRVEMRLLERRAVRPSRDVARALATSERTATLLERLAIVQDEPVALFRSHLSPKRFRGVGAKVAERGSLATVLEEDYGVVPVRADTLVEVGRCTTAESAVLQIPAGSSLLIARGTSYDAADEPVEHFDVRYRADRIRLRLESRHYAEQVVRPGNKPTSTTGKKG